MQTRSGPALDANIHIESGWPVIGVFPDFIKNPAEYCYRTMLRGLEKGKRVSRMKVLTKKTYLLTDPADVEDVLLNPETTKRLWKGDSFTRSDVLFGNGLVLADGDGWRQNRRILQPGFNSGRFQDLASQMTRIVGAGLDGWHSSAAAGEPIEIGPAMMRFTLLIIMKLMFSIEPTKEELRETEIAFGAALKHISLLLGTYAVPRRWQRLLYPSRAFRAAMRFLYDLVERSIQAHRERPSDYDDLLTIILASRYEDGSPMAPEQIRDEVITVLFGGYEATADAMTSCLWMLSEHPEVQEKLRAEVVARLGSASDGGRDPLFADLYDRGTSSTAMTYLRQTLDETIRLWAPFWLVLRGTREEAVDLGDCRIPGNAEVVVCPYATHRHPDYWERPLEFDPERFAPETSRNRRAGAYYPFALGQRKCIGEHIAKIEMRMIIAMILQRYRFTPVGKPKMHVEATTRFQNLCMRIEPLA